MVVGQQAKLDRATRAYKDHLSHFAGEDPLAIFDPDSPHTGVLSTLIRDSLKSAMHKVLGVTENRYLAYLSDAMQNAATFDGIQYGPMRWFRETESGAGYLDQLRLSTMSRKRRIFIVSESWRQLMEEDVGDNELLAFYWGKTGADVRTWWILEQDLMEERPQLQGQIQDCVLYNDDLLISYDDDSNILTYARGDAAKAARDVFEALESQLAVGSSRPFVEIKAT